MKIKQILSLLVILFLASCASKKNSGVADAPLQPKREFRGAWIQAVNGQFMGMDEKTMKKYLTEMLDNLQKVHVNAVIFQVRVEGDALYESKLEPWSRYLTGTQGRSPGWDPLAFMVEECHTRKMELQAWINPYRACTKGTKKVDPGHMSSKKPENFIKYDGQLFFNPALESNREHICNVVKDIVGRYDVDGIHMDDYFYPYPAKGKDFPDDKWFRNSGGKSKAEWRRNNVNELILQLHKTVRASKPWVKFGISPFGIYRNARTWEFGSKTTGLQCYDDLYADVLMWIDEGWIDYCLPQLYWEIGHSAADYEELVAWWAENASGRPLYIGQDVNRTVKAKDDSSITGNQQLRKYDMQRAQKNILGSCFWDAASAANNVGGYRDVMEEEYFRYPALMPKYTFIDNVAPNKVNGVSVIDDKGDKVLVWLVDEKVSDVMNAPYRYVVYCFGKGEAVNLDDPSKIMKITARPYLVLPEDMHGSYVFVVTVLDRMHNESAGVKYKVKL